MDYSYISNFNTYKDIENGIVLLIRGGGVKSASAVGTLKALEEYNIPIVSVSGASIGSIPAALVACNYNADEILDIFIKYSSIIAKSSKLLLGKGSVEIENNLNELLKFRTFENTDIPCYINASDGPFFNASPFVFCSEVTPHETLAKACRASSSMPFIYGQYNVNINGERFSFTDGGATLNPYVPKSNGHITIYSSFISNKERRALNRKKLYSWEKPPYKTSAKSDIVIIPELGGIGTTGTIKDMYEAYNKGYNETIEMLDKILEKNRTIH